MSVMPDASKHSKRLLFSPDVFVQIVKMVEQGVSPPEIAARIGCTLGSLRVKCSMCGISLRRAVAVEGLNSLVRLNVKLSRDVAVRLQQHGRKGGLSGTKLASMIIETVVQDELYDAVIDCDPSGRDPALPDRSRSNRSRTVGA